MRYGVKDYVLKPVDPDTFHTTIGKVKDRASKYPVQEAEGREREEFSSSVFSSDLPVFRK